MGKGKVSTGARSSILGHSGKPIFPEMDSGGIKRPFYAILSRSDDDAPRTRQYHDIQNRVFHGGVRPRASEAPRARRRGKLSHHSSAFNERPSSVQSSGATSLNAEFAPSALEAGSAFAPYIGTRLPDILCSQFERTLDNDNRVSYEGRKLQIPASSTRANYVKTQVRVHRYVDGTLAIFHGPRKLAAYDAQGKPRLQEKKQAA